MARDRWVAGTARQRGCKDTHHHAASYRRAWIPRVSRILIRRAIKIRARRSRLIRFRAHPVAADHAETAAYTCDRVNVLHVFHVRILKMLGGSAFKGKVEHYYLTFISKSC